MAPDWNAPKGVENVHKFCAGKPESEDWGNNRSVKHSKILSMYKALSKLRILILLCYCWRKRECMWLLFCGCVNEFLMMFGVIHPLMCYSSAEFKMLKQRKVIIGKEKNGKRGRGRNKRTTT